MNPACPDHPLPPAMGWYAFGATAAELTPNDLNPSSSATTIL
jgi:hypothetical protein